MLRISLSSVLLLSLGCDHETPMLGMLGEKEAVLIDAWGEPIVTHGKDFQFFEPYGAPKTLFYKRQGKDIAVTIKAGAVFSISLVDPVGLNEKQKGKVPAEDPHN